MAGSPQDGRTTTRGKVAAWVQVGLGAFGFAYEVLTPGERPYIIFATIVLVGAAPATAVLERLLRGGGR